MRLKLALAFFCCGVVFVYLSKANPTPPVSSNKAKPNQNVQLTTNDLSTQKRQQWQDFRQSQTITPEPRSPIPLDALPTKTEKSESQVSDTPPINSVEPFSGESYMTLAPTATTNALGNPIYELRLYGNGQLLGTYATVTGKANTQNKNRHQEGSEAPLPDGQYTVASSTVLGTEPEVGERFLPIQPLFSTGRSALGIHYDPSFGKQNGEDGTQGCIALTHKQDLNQVLDYVDRYQPQYLEVKIKPI